MHVTLHLVLAATLLSLPHAWGWKEKEFKKCNDLGFCRRHRNKAGTQWSVLPDSLQLDGSLASAVLVNQEAPGKQFTLILTAHQDGFIRVRVDEPGQGRYQITDIAGMDTLQRVVNWEQTSKDQKQVVLTAKDASVQLGFSPFRLTFSVSGKPTVVMNSRDMFAFEHKRTKEEDPETSCDGCYEETFLGNQDSKPRGPQAVSLDIIFPGFDHVYGLPEHATSLVLKPTIGAGIESEPYRLYNLDVFEYLHESPFGLYGSIPFMVAHKAGLTTGVFWLNAAEMYVDVAKTSEGTATQWIAESGAVDFYVFVGPTPKTVASQYAALTGTTAMPQLFSLGYHQCRWNYKDEADVKAVDAAFDTHAIPYDVIWLDIEHTNGKRYLTWDSHLFPEPIAMQDDLGSRGRKLVTIVDPHVKRDSNYYIFSEAEAAKFYVRNKHNTDFDGWCWPGGSSYLDVTSPVVREWWAQQFTLDKYKGSTKHLYIWNDMNEPSVFNGPEITMPKDNLHFGDTEHRDVHNSYGLYYHDATAEGLVTRGREVFGEDGDRPFVLSRAFFAGSQRVGPIWTGDNRADWDHLKVSVPMLLTLAVTGLPFSGADVGGFFGNPTPELFVRWYQLGTFYPFFRGHGHLETARREPWMMGEPYTTRLKDAIRSRYALMPYFYTLFRHANISGAPVLAPTWYEFPENKDTFTLDEQLMLGSAILVRPVLSEGATSVDVTLPRTARWYDMLSGVEMEKSAWLPGRDQVFRVQVNADSIPAYYRGGSVVPRRERPRRSTAQQETDPLTLVISLDHQQQATGDLYLDDGHSFAFLRGQYVHRQFSYSGGKLVASTAPAAPGTPAGVLALPNLLVERIVFLGLPKKGSFKATLPGGQVVALEPGPLSQRAAIFTQGQVLRKPALLATGDWTVVVSKA